MLPAAASIRKQGASRGATTSFLISTPESGLDSMAVTYALLDPLMTLARPLAAMISAVGTGLLEGLWPDDKAQKLKPDLSCPVDGCCDGTDCDPKLHAHHHPLGQKLAAGIRYALGELWTDLAGWFWLGLLLAGAVTALLPAGLLAGALGGGLGSMLIMLAAGVPLYICATASTPIAAALILKGASPGAALVFLMAGPATNLASLTMLTGLLGKRAMLLYLAGIAVFSVACGLALDQVYAGFGISAKALAGQAREALPFWLRLGGTIILAGLSLKALWQKLALKGAGPAGESHPPGRVLPLAGPPAENAPAESASCGSG